MKPMLLVVAALFLGACGAPPAMPQREAPAAATPPVRETVCLNGLWDFRAQSSTAAAMPADGWRPLRVPSSWGSSGVGKWDGGAGFAFSAEEAAAPAAWYRRSIAVPARWQGAGRVLLRLDAVVDGHQVVVNGVTVRDNPLQGLCERIDITDHLRFGADNQVAVLTRAFADAAPGKTQHNGRVVQLSRADRGLVRDVWLERVPTLRVDWSHALPNVRERRLTVRARLVNDGDREQRTTLGAQVLDNGRPVLALPAQAVTVPARSAVEVETAAPWADPVLWGFGDYGRPHLYTLRTELDGGADRRDDRFGFREFRAEGERLLFNGKPFFIKGDLTSRRGIFPESPTYVTAYYQRMRDGGMNFQRMHSGLNSHFDDPSWYQVADEVGMLVEAQMARYTSDGRWHGADSPAVHAAWTDYVNQHFNHPSLVMWCLDNETFSLPAKQLDTLPVEDIRAYDRLATLVHRLDPTRLVDLHDGWVLHHFIKDGDAAGQGAFSRANFQLFNIHPYGKLDAQVLKHRQEVNYTGGVPTIIGELYTFPKAIDPLNTPGLAFGEQYRAANSYVTQITDVATVPGVAGIILCAMNDSGWIGFSEPGRWHLGPWTDLAVQRDAQGEPAGMRHGVVSVPWPSLSGTGVKVESAPLWHLRSDTTFGANLNWFDAARPMWLNSLVDRQAKQAFDRLGQGPEAPLNSERAIEVLAGLADQGRPLAGALVALVPLEGQAQVPAVLSDLQGSAWLRAWEQGRYRLRAELGGRVWEQDLALQRPALTTQAGFGHLQIVALGGADAAALRARLAGPVAFTGFERQRYDMLANGGFDYWQADTPLRWTGEARLGSAPKEGAACATISGPTGMLTAQIKLEAGRHYTLAGWIRSAAAGAKVQVKGARYALLAEAEVPAAPGWQRIESTFTAPHTTVGYVYCRMTGSGEASFDGLTLIAGEPVEPPLALDPGPYRLGGQGYIRQWLALGPFPNRSRPDGSYEGFATDWLADQGGEAAARPVFAATASATFPAGSYWKPGQATLRWRQLSSGSDRVLLNSIGLPRLNISDVDPVHVTAYLACTVISPDERSAELAIGSDDGYKIWLNGEQVAAMSVCRGSAPDQERHPLKLRRGENRLLLKIFQDSGGYNCWVRFLNPEGRPMTDLQVRLEGEPTGVRTLTPEGGGRPLPLAAGWIAYEVLGAQGTTSLRRRELASGLERDLGAGGGALAEPGGDGLLFLRGTTLMRQRGPTPAASVAVAGGAVQRLWGWLDHERLIVGTADGLRLLRLAADGASLAPWAAGAGASEAVVSPDRRLIARVVADAGSVPVLTVMELAGGKVVAGPFSVAGSSTGRVGGCHSPAFSPDGRRLAFVRAGIQPEADIALVDLASGRESALTSDRARNRAPAFSADGRSVLFSAAKDGEQERCYSLRVP